ncbi:VOC family protein [Ramlibacter sp. XY19]|uniref:VOC family protein n=1 Tax=Ramlibacter paludis TaxID=2908000 RepID=UPI0023DB4CA1|nr:VOC family protein [Ramlibacter paludis]MCG2593661.1 VOC family protein [Ramlibacter paludis]
MDNADVMATAAVRDLGRARAFYEGKLGLEPQATEENMASYRCGAGTLLIYESGFAGTNQATAATFGFRSGLVEAVRALEGKGVRFEHYDLPETVREGAIHRGHGRSVAWCKDPDGNILCFAEG